MSPIVVAPSPFINGTIFPFISSILDGSLVGDPFTTLNMTPVRATWPGVGYPTSTTMRKAISVVNYLNDTIKFTVDNLSINYSVRVYTAGLGYTALRTNALFNNAWRKTVPTGPDDTVLSAAPQSISKVLYSPFDVSVNTISRDPVAESGLLLRNFIGVTSDRVAKGVSPGPGTEFVFTYDIEPTGTILRTGVDGLIPSVKMNIPKFGVYPNILNTVTNPTGQANFVIESCITATINIPDSSVPLNPSATSDVYLMLPVGAFSCDTFSSTSSRHIGRARDTAGNLPANPSYLGIPFTALRSQPIILATSGLQDFDEQILGVWETFQTGIGSTMEASLAKPYYPIVTSF